MTIAACYVAPDGVVFAADTASTNEFPGGSPRLFYGEQKIFSIGEHSQLGLLSWGLARFGRLSIRTLVAQFADKIKEKGPLNVASATEAWVEHIWPLYQREVHENAQIQSMVTRLNELASDAQKSQELHEVAAKLDSWTSGFCIGGCGPDKIPEAYELSLSPMSVVKPTAEAVEFRIWGDERIINQAMGMFPDIFADILSSDKWGGTEEELGTIFRRHCTTILWPLPHRDAAELVYALFQAAITIAKFASRPPTFGGRVEMAVVVPEAPFVWLKHDKSKRIE